MPDSKLYDLLGVKREASEAEIKRAYKKLAKQYHPDRHSGSSGSEHSDGEKFKEIGFAHEVLTNPQKRNIYDRGGLEALKEGGQSQGFEDIFEHLFGGGGGGGFPGGMFGGGMGGLFGGGSPFGHSHGGRGGRRQGEDTVFPLTVTLEDLYKGKTVKISIDKTILCPSCNGYGGKSGSASRCNPCRGQGIKVSLRPIGPGMMQQVQEECQKCRGTGQDFSDADRCKKCDGKQVSREKKVQEIVVDKGKRHGDKVVLRGAGDQKPNVEPGDVVVVLQMVKHDTFDRDGNHLLTKMNIDLVEALCGMSRPLKHLDGRTLLITRKPGQITEPGEIYTVIGEGMPTQRDPTTCGNLMIKFDIKFPESNWTSPEQIKKLESVLGPRPPQPTNINVAEVEEVVLHDFDAEHMNGRAGHGGGNAYDEDGDEDGPQGPGGVRCATQ
ncbi:DnaJ-like protein subfamily A member 2 [Hypsibius exemplaris]|uniref:DnaJ-like protein subfamily A member 2 n=1 Tax=Hypsibius exemplaris TaxID=2072580 RepID=A0A1W0X1Y9_HYPEX|nr:DnaJ-like protein subfamily A member 2 [Hypsibius exemplaris]